MNPAQLAASSRPLVSGRWPRRIQALASLAAACHAAAQEAPVQSIVVTGSRIETSAFDAPYAIGVVTGDDLRAAGPMVNLSEALAQVPGLVLNNRSNYAQDLQISSRGFGARASFGVRGMRLYTDGIPATMPDGSGSVSHFDLAGAERIEVLRGPFSALYGNSSGGVIALFTEDPRSSSVEIEADGATFGEYQGRVSAAARLDGGWTAKAGISHFEIQGFRPHSAARRDQFNGRLGYAGAADHVTLLFSGLDQPADDPLGLTRSQFDTDPYQTTPQAIQFDTRKQSTQNQVGANWQHRFGGALDRSELTAYVGRRSVTQWQSIPPAAQASPTQPGGVIDFDRTYQGLDARLVWRLPSARVVAGANVEMQHDDRRGYENFLGSPTDPTALGVTGKLRRDETDTARSADLYGQAEFDLSPSVLATLGVRGGQLRFESRDHYINAQNGDDSGSRDFSYTNPLAAISWRAAPNLRVYASAGKGFEAPTLNELAYRADGSSGFNDTLKPQTSRQLELGSKWRSGDGAATLDLALFDIRTTNELGVLTNAGGRATYQNVGRTERRGIEASSRLQVAANLQATFALTWLSAKYADSFTTCTGTPCSNAFPANIATVAAGNRIAGVPRANAYAALAWQAGDRTVLAAEWRAQGSTAVNDLNTDFAGGYGAFALRASHSYRFGNGTELECFGRIDNLGDRAYAGSVIVNESNGRFFEPAPPRALLVGLRVRWGS